MNEFADRLRADREKSGLTVRELAELSGISFSYITKIETGRTGNGVSPEIVTAVARALERDELEYLYLSGVVPSPLSNLLSNAQSRTFVRALLSSGQKNVGWDRLQSVLSESPEGNASDANANRKPSKQSRRKVVA